MNVINIFLPIMLNKQKYLKKTTSKPETLDNFHLLLSSSTVAANGVFEKLTGQKLLPQNISPLSAFHGLLL